MQCTTSPGGLLFECLDGCGRRVVVEGTTGEMTVIDRGDPSVAHRGSSGGVDFARVHLEQ